MNNQFIKIGALVAMVLSLIFPAKSECSRNEVDGFRPGITRQALTEEFERKGWPLSSQRRSGTEAEFFYVPRSDLRFWVDSDSYRVIAVGGKIARFRGKELSVDLRESEVIDLLGEPDRLQVQEAMEDVSDARYLYYEGQEMVLKVALGNPLPRGQSEWVVTNLYLYEPESGWQRN